MEIMFYLCASTYAMQEFSNLILTQNALSLVS